MLCVEILHPQKARVQDDRKALLVSKLGRGRGKEKPKSPCSNPEGWGTQNRPNDLVPRPPAGDLSAAYRLPALSSVCLWGVVARGGERYAGIQDQ